MSTQKPFAHNVGNGKFWRFLLYSHDLQNFIFGEFIKMKMFKLDLAKAEEPEIKLPTSAGSWKKQESSRKTSTLLTMSKPLTIWITTNCGKFFKRWKYQTTLPAS